MPLSWLTQSFYHFFFSTLYSTWISIKLSIYIISSDPFNITHEHTAEAIMNKQRMHNNNLFGLQLIKSHVSKKWNKIEVWLGNQVQLINEFGRDGWTYQTLWHFNLFKRIQLNISWNNRIKYDGAWIYTDRNSN